MKTQAGDETPLRGTPLHSRHVELGAKLVPFAGFEMPVQYPTGITAEHRAVRTAAGLFDVSHMGELEVTGERAAEFVQFVTTNDVLRLEVGQAQYSMLVDHEGHVIDDLLVYRLPDRFMLVVNASNRDEDREWVRAFAPEFAVEVIDRSDHVALLALQGPRAQAILQPLVSAPLDTIGYYRFREDRVDGRRAIVSRTGYTGEDGFELYVDADDAVHLWDRLLAVGGPEGLIAAGLGARDSLRLEMGYALYGNDIDRTRSPLEAGLGWVVKLDKGDFVGRDSLARSKERGVRERLVGFRLLERGFPRPGYPVRVDGADAGVVTSGVLSPSLGEGIGMAYVPIAHAKPGSRLEIAVRGRGIPAEVVRPPFYAEGSVRS